MAVGVVDVWLSEIGAAAESTSVDQDSPISMKEKKSKGVGAWNTEVGIKVDVKHVSPRGCVDCDDDPRPKIT